MGFCGLGCGIVGVVGDGWIEGGLCGCLGVFVGGGGDYGLVEVFGCGCWCVDG